MRYYLFVPVLFILCHNYNLLAQNNLVKDSSIIRIDTIDKVYHFVEKMPEYHGGNQTLIKYIAENLKYPITDVCYGGKVYVRFIIDENGNVTKPEVLRGVDPLLDKEAIRVVNKLPQWKPGELNGKKVKVWYTVPISICVR